MAPSHEELVQQTDVLRDRIGKTMAAIRTMNDAVEYEFGAGRERQIETAERILRAALTAVALIWNELAILHKAEDTDFLTNAALIKLRRQMEQSLNALALYVLQEAAPENSAFSAERLSQFAEGDLLSHPRYGEYARHLARFRELQAIVAGLAMQDVEPSVAATTFSMPGGQPQ